MSARSAAAPEERNYSVVAAIVTDNNDPDHQGRVRVRYGWMSEQQNSDWIALAPPTAGHDCGLFFVPEPEDQVLVAFAYGQVDRAYVIGCLWSRVDPPPDAEPDHRMIKSRSGHTILLDDTRDAEQITIVDKSGGNKIVLDTRNNAITIESAGDLTLKAAGNLVLQADGDVTLRAANVSVEARATLAVRGQQTTIDGDAGVNVNGGALEVI